MTISLAAARMPMLFSDIRCRPGLWISHFQQEIQHEQRTDDRHDSERRSQREHEEAHPDQPFEKVVRVTRVIPKSAITDFSFVARICFECLELCIGNAVACNGDDPNHRAGYLKCL